MYKVILLNGGNNGSWILRQTPGGKGISKCGKYHKFINDDDVFYYVGVGCRIVNKYGPLFKTKLYQLKDIAAFETFYEKRRKLMIDKLCDLLK